MAVFNYLQALFQKGSVRTKALNLKNGRSDQLKMPTRASKLGNLNESGKVWPLNMKNI